MPTSISLLAQESTRLGLFSAAPLVIAFPALGLAVNMIFGKRLSERGIGIVASSAVGLSFVVAVLQFLQLQMHPEGTRLFLAQWIHAGGLSVPWALKVDTLSVAMMLMVSGVSTLIHIYAIGYMRADVRFQGDPTRFRRFFVFFNLFVAAMMILVTADNFVMMFVGWEGVGLCSFLLISFWFEKGERGIGNAIAGKKAFVANRVGDAGFLLAVFTVFVTFGTLQFDEVFRAAKELGPEAGAAIGLITLFLLLGVTGKSAQLPLFVWLPDAMAGPTPVSALIHAATMVTAGIYLIVRTHVLFELARSSSQLVALVGGLTALLAATIAVGQLDIKKVLAYSTISQLGFMVAAVGLGAYVAGMFHLLTHAFFKALLFLGSGSVIQGLEHAHHHLEHQGQDDDLKDFDPQDMRTMGGLRSRMGTTFAVYLAGALALAGIPPLAGFFSKDEILLDASLQSGLIYGLLAAAAFLTAFYMGRQLLLVFFGEPRSGPAEHARDNPALMTIPLIVLAVLSLVGGALNLPGLHSLTLWLEHTLGEVHAPEFGLQVALISTVLALIGLIVSGAIYRREVFHPVDRPDPLQRGLGPLFQAIRSRWWIDDFYQWAFVGGYSRLANLLVVPAGAEDTGSEFWERWVHQSFLQGGFKGLVRLLTVDVEGGMIDGLANALGRWTKRLAGRLGQVETGYVRNYALAVFVGVVLILGYLLIGLG